MTSKKKSKFRVAACCSGAIVLALFSGQANAGKHPYGSLTGSQQPAVSGTSKNQIGKFHPSNPIYLKNSHSSLGTSHAFAVGSGLPVLGHPVGGPLVGNGNGIHYYSPSAGGGSHNAFNVFAHSHYHWPHGYSYTRFEIGVAFPHRFWNHSYYVNDYADFNVAPPPPDYQWMRYGPDLVLVDLDSGEISNVVYGAFPDGE